MGREFQSRVVRGKKLLTETSLQHLGMVSKREVMINTCKSTLEFLEDLIEIWIQLIIN